MPQVRPTLVIDGTDFSTFIPSGGIQWSRNDIDAAGAGRDMRGTMRRKRIGYKAKLQVTCRKLTTPQLQLLNTKLNSTYVTVSYLNPMSGAVREAQFYGSTINAAVLMYEDGVCLWDGVSFNLIEV